MNTLNSLFFKVKFKFYWVTQNHTIDSCSTWSSRKISEQKGLKIFKTSSNQSLLSVGFRAEKNNF